MGPGLVANVFNSYTQTLQHLMFRLNLLSPQIFLSFASITTSNLDNIIAYLKSKISKDFDNIPLIILKRLPTLVKIQLLNFILLFLN